MRWVASFYIGFVLASCVPEPETPLGLVYIDRAPPDLRPEAVGVAPREGLVWRQGYWRWNGNDFEWTPGEWVAVPSGFRGWAPGHWIRTGKGWFFVEGHWR